MLPKVLASIIAEWPGVSPDGNSERLTAACPKTPRCKKFVTFVSHLHGEDCTVMGRLFQPLLFLLASSTAHELRRQVQFLKAENEMLRRRVPKQRILLSKVERERLIKLGKAIGPGVSKLITIVHPRTFQRWIQRCNAGKTSKRIGRPKTLESVQEIVLRIAKDTGWGYGRIAGELKKLRIRLAQSTIKNILKEAGMLPRPKRGQGTWDEFVKIHADTLWQIDFFSKCIWTPSGLRQCFVLAFIHVATRRAYCSPCCFQPNAKWMERQAEVFLNNARTEGLRVEQVTRDRDAMFVKTGFDAVLKKAGVRVITTAAHAPNQNAYVERWIQSIKSECLRYFIVFGQRHFDFLISAYVEFFNTVRPRQGVGNRPLAGNWIESDDPLKPGERILCHAQLGGLLRHYECRAA